MAQVRLSGLLTDIKGSIGGTTFQKSGSGLTMRNKPLPLKSKTNAQTTVRILQSRLNAEWLNLSDTQRSTWQSFAEFTNGYGLTNRQNSSANTGKMQFMAVNFWVLLYNKPLITVPTFTPPLSPVIPCPPLYDTSETLMNYDGNLDTSIEILVTRVSLPQSKATNTANTGFRTLVYNQINGDTQNWAAAYQATFGIALVLGKKYWIELQKVNFITGAISAPARKLVLYEIEIHYFTFTIDTTLIGSASDTFILPLIAGAIDCTVLWGDGQENHYTTGGNKTHVYAIGGIYTVRITGSFIGIQFANIGDRRKVTGLISWGDIVWKSFFQAFMGCSNMVALYSDIPNLALTNLSFQSAFQGCSLFNGDIYWFPSNITSLFQTFSAASLFNKDLSFLSVGSVTSMFNMGLNAGFSSANIDNFLINCANQAPLIQNNVPLRIGTATRTSASNAAVAILTGAPYNWTITNP